MVRLGVWEAATGWEPTHTALLEGGNARALHLEVYTWVGSLGRNVANYTYMVLYSSVIL